MYSRIDPYSNVRNELKLADRIIIDMDGYDLGFAKACSEIFSIDLWLDGLDSVMLRGWISTAIMEIVTLFTISPGTLYGTINLGPDLSPCRDNRMEYQYYPKLSSYSKEQLEEFSLAYKALAANMYACMNKKLRPYIDKAFELDYSDVACSVFRYAPGLLILNVRAILPFPNTP